MSSNVAKEALALIELRDLASWSKSQYTKFRRNLQQRDINFNFFSSSKSDLRHLKPKRKSSLLGQNAPMVPTILDDLTTIIGEHRSMEGLFRIEARKSEVDLLELNVSHQNDTHSRMSLNGIEIRLACSFLKRWLRQLPEAVIPRNLQPLCVALGERFAASCDSGTYSSVADAAMAVQLVSLLLSPERLAILCHLSEFLTQIIEEKSNMMDAEALSRLFGPCIFGTERLPSSLHPYKIETALKDYVRLVLQYHHLLGVSPEELCVVAATPQKKVNRGKLSEAGSLYSLRKLRIPKKMSIKRSKSMHDHSQNGGFSMPVKKSKAPSKGVLHSLMRELSKNRAIVPQYAATLEEPENLEWKPLFSSRNQQIIG